MIDAFWFRLKSFLNKSFFTNKKGRVRRYAVPILFAGLVIIAKSLAIFLFTEDFSLHLIFIAVILSAWYGGFGPGLFATLLIGTLNDYLFEAPRFTINYHSLISLFIFFLEGLLVSIIAEAKRQSDMQKDEFIAQASHELKNPLASIKAFAGILTKKLRRQGNKDLAYITRKIDEQADRATTLINELLDVTKIDTHKLQLNNSKFAIYDFVKETVKEQQVVNQTHKILLSGISKKKVHADKDRLKQVLVNLISNAVKYSPDANKVLVTIDDSKEVTIAVKDFGVGIDGKHIRKVFDRYYRTRSAEKGKAQGLGLGLFISAQIIKRMDGRIWVESVKGQGSTFYVALPTKR